MVERKNRHLLDVVRTLLLESFVPSRFWCETLTTTVHLINRMPSLSLNNETPFFRLFGHNPDYSNLRVFGRVCFVHLSLMKGLNSRLNRPLVHQKGFVCYDPHLHRNRISRNVIFFK